MLLFIVFVLFTALNIWISYYYNNNDFSSNYKKSLNPTKKQKFLNAFNEFMDNWWSLIVLFIGIGIIGIGSCILTFVIVYTTGSSELAYKQAEYDVIVYQLENEMYSSSLDAGQLQVEDENKSVNTENKSVNTENKSVNTENKSVNTENENLVDSGKIVIGYGQRELMEDVSNWNSWLSQRNIMEKNIWVGVFYPKWSDKLELIDLNQYKY